jgi:flagellin-like hook-associated protein FlgL
MSGNEAVTPPGTAAKTAQASQGSNESGQPSLADLVPAVTDAPKGEVTLGEKAGAFGPWRAHRVIDGIAQLIGDSTILLLGKPGASAARVLVVDDRLLLPSDWTAHFVRSSLERLRERLAAASSQLEERQKQLATAIARPGQEEAKPPAPVGGRRRGGAQGADDVTKAATSAPNVPAGALGAAVNLLGLLRTDYTITATAVSATPSELSTLTAAYLAKPQLPKEGKPSVTVTAEADGFSTVGPSPTANLFKSVMTRRDTTVQKLSDLQASLAPVQAELSAVNARIASVEQAWAAAIADKKDADIAALQITLDALADQAAQLGKAAGPAAAVVAYVQQVIADVDTGATSLLQASGTGHAPLFTAVRYERLDQTVESRKITHVLYVNLDAVAADAVTRQSILGTSGRIRFLSSGNASWLLMNTADGSITGGGQANLADVMSFGLDTGKAQFRETAGLASSDVDTDPLEKLEVWAKGFVAVLVIVLFALGVLSVIAVARIALG